MPTGLRLQQVDAPARATPKASYFTCQGSLMRCGKVPGSVGMGHPGLTTLWDLLMHHLWHFN